MSVNHEFCNSFYTVLCYPPNADTDCVCSICAQTLSGDVYLEHSTNKNYHTKCVISYWEGLDRSKLKYRSIRDKYILVYIDLYKKLQEKSFKKYGKPLFQLDSVSINQFILENLDTIKKMQIFLEEIRYQDTKS